jgi:hypothetical protein
MKKDEVSPEPRRKPRKFLPWLVFLSVLALALFVHRCPREQVIPSPLPSEATILVPETLEVPPPDTLSKTVRKIPPEQPIAQRDSDPVATHPLDDSLPYVFADPWGGRHFDSVAVRLHCVEDCAILYSLEDSVNLKSYEGQFTFRRNTVLWYAGVTPRGRQTEVKRLEYVIEKNPGNCPAGTMPIKVGERNICVDIYEWPNREGALPQTMVNRTEAEDSCRSAGKRLCALDEWRESCEGPENSEYPYGEKYDSRYCRTKQTESGRSGRNPACRSYYGVYDLSGNVWEWTSTPDPDHEDFFFVTGGNWEAAEKATCSLSKYSFYPQNKYPGVGFRCCADAK